MSKLENHQEKDSQSQPDNIEKSGKEISKKPSKSTAYRGAALGKGLDAIFKQQTDRNVETGQQHSGYKFVSVASLYPNKDQPRKNFSDESLLQLAVSIEEHGLIQPILVRPIDDSEHFQIIAGERRWRAAQKAGLHEVPIITKNCDDNNTLQLAIVENLQRDNLTAFEEARAYQKLITDHNYSQEDLSGIVGKSRSHIANLLRILNLSDKVEKAVSDNKLSTGHIKCLVGLDDEIALKTIDTVVKNNLNVRQLEKYVNKIKAGYTKSRSSVSKPTDLIDLEYTLSKIIGLEVSINYSQSKSSYMRINFKRLGELDGLMDKLMRATVTPDSHKTLSDETE